MENNPLRQFFRRPAVQIKLPSGGKQYSASVLEMPESGELPVYPMTAIDEITSRTPDALFNGTALTDLIQSCVPAIKDPWNLESTDIDAILIAIKAAGGKQDLEVETVCPKCKDQSTFKVNIVGMLSTLKSGDFDTPLQVQNLKVKFKPLIYKEMNEGGLEQFTITNKYRNLNNMEDVAERNKLTTTAIKEITILTMKLLSRSIEYIETDEEVRVSEFDFIFEFVSSADKKTFESLRDHHTAIKSSSDLKPLDITCANEECGHKFTQPFSINPTDFFA
jgi:hypothetical protein|tara:strand:+ start:1057 stop:1890 length:834 start_codon:yes stop_codon:yes gene_type:complete